MRRELLERRGDERVDPRGSHAGDVEAEVAERANVRGRRDRDHARVAELVATSEVELLERVGGHERREPTGGDRTAGEREAAQRGEDAGRRERREPGIVNAVVLEPELGESSEGR